MEYKCLFGSKMLKLNNCQDEDWLIFIDKKGCDIRDNKYRSIPFYTTMLNHFILGRNAPDDRFKTLFLYQLSAPFINDENYPFNFFNILEHKKVWIEQLKNYINLEKVEKWAMGKDILPKWFYHLVYQYNMIIEDTHWISDEAKVDVQKIHDFEMPSSYFYELRDKINSL